MKGETPQPILMHYIFLINKQDINEEIGNVILETFTNKRSRNQY